MSRADNSVKNLPISNPKPDLHNINAHTKFGENPLMFTQVIIWKRKTDGRTTDWQMDGRTHGHPTWNHNTPPLSCGRVWKWEDLQTVYKWKFFANKTRYSSRTEQIYFTWHHLIVNSMFNSNWLQVHAFCFLIWLKCLHLSDDASNYH